MIRIITAACWTITGLALIGLTLWFLTGSAFGLRGVGIFSGWSIGTGWETLTGPYEPVGVYNIDIGGIDSLNINWITGAVTVSPYDGLDIQITEFAQRALDDDESLQYDASGSTLTIRYKARTVTFGNSPQKRLEVLVPRTLSAGLESLAIDSSSASIDIREINASGIKIDAVSGSITLSDIAAQTVDASTTSGSIIVSAADADELKLRSVSGSIRASESHSAILDCSTTAGSINASGSFEQTAVKSVSGAISLDNYASASTVRVSSTSGATDISGSYDSVDFSSVSGRVSVSSLIVPSSLRASTTSGKIIITVPDEGAISVNHSSVSGKISSEIPILTQSNDSQFRISTVSANVEIIAHS